MKYQSSFVVIEVLMFIYIGEAFSKPQIKIQVTAAMTAWIGNFNWWVRIRAFVSTLTNSDLSKQSYCWSFVQFWNFNVVFFGKKWWIIRLLMLICIGEAFSKPQFKLHVTVTTWIGNLRWRITMCLMGLMCQHLQTVTRASKATIVLVSSFEIWM